MLLSKTTSFFVPVINECLKKTAEENSYIPVFFPFYSFTSPVKVKLKYKWSNLSFFTCLFCLTMWRILDKVSPYLSRKTRVLWKKNVLLVPVLLPTITLSETYNLYFRFLFPIFLENRNYAGFKCDPSFVKLAKVSRFIWAASRRKDDKEFISFEH